jgi:hypothetical protein
MVNKEKTVASTVAHFLMLKTVSIGMYTGNVNQFINIINGKDWENIAEKHYPGKDIQFFKDVLDALNVPYTELTEHDITRG